eukprot:4295043-Prymnesium_polylepis.1
MLAVAALLHRHPRPNGTCPGTHLYILTPEDAQHPRTPDPTHHPVVHCHRPPPRTTLHPTRTTPTPTALGPPQMPLRT